MLVWILILYLYGRLANPRRIAVPRMLVARLVASWGRRRSASRAAAPDRPARSP